MTAVARHYLKVFALTGLIFGMFQLGSDIVSAEALRMDKYALAAVFFGSAMSLSLVSLHIYSLKRLGIEDLTTENLTVDESSTVHSPLNWNEVREKLVHDPLIRRMKLKDEDQALFLRHGLSWSSFGEKISIRKLEATETGFRYLIRSKPIFRMTLADYGQNLRNVRHLEQLLQTG